MSERTKRRDANQKQIIRDLERAGVSVKDTSQLSEFLDIACGRAGRNYLFEIKDPDKPPSARKLTPGEQKFHDRWNGQVDVIFCAEDALRIMGIG